MIFLLIELMHNCPRPFFNTKFVHAYYKKRVNKEK